MVIYVETQRYVYVTDKGLKLPIQTESARSASTGTTQRGGGLRNAAHVFDSLFHLYDLLFQFSRGTVDPLQAFEVVAKHLGNLRHRVIRRHHFTVTLYGH